MGLLTSLFAVSPDSPTFNLNDPAAWDYLTDGGPSATGVRVSAKSSLQLPAWWRGINLLAGYVAKIPLHIYKRVGNNKERDPSHPAYQLLRHRAIPQDAHPLTSFVWKQTMMNHALARGNGYTYIQRKGYSAPAELWILDPDATCAVRENNRLWYTTTWDHGGRREWRKLPAADVIHIHGLGYDGIQGYDVLTVAREALGRGLAQQKYESVWFKNSGRASVILTTPTRLDKVARDELRASWERMHSGIENAHRTAVLDNGLTAKELTGSQRDGQFVERQKFSLIDVANILGLPVHKVGGEGRTAFASLEQENQSMLDDTLDVWLVQIEEECREKLLSDDEKTADTHVVEFLREALVRANLTDRANYYRTATGGRPWMLPDEVRGKENMNELGGEAAEYLNPLNMGQGGAQNEPVEPKPTPPAKPPAKLPPPDDGEDDAEARQREAHRQLLSRAVVNLTRRIAASAEKAAKTPAGFMAWLDRIETDHGRTASESLSPFVDLTGRDVPAWFCRVVHENYFDLCDTATGKSLAGDVAALGKTLETKLAADAVARFLGDDDACAIA